MARRIAPPAIGSSVSEMIWSMRGRGSPGVHLGVSVRNESAQRFYRRLGFRELIRVGTDSDGVVYMGKTLGS